MLAVGWPPERIDDIIDSSLEKLAAAVGHDQSSLVEFRSDDRSAVVTHSYAVPSATPVPLGALDDDRFPCDLEQIRRGDTVFMRHPSELPLEAEEERQCYTAVRIKSNVAIPLKVAVTARVRAWNSRQMRRQQ